MAHIRCCLHKKYIGIENQKRKKQTNLMGITECVVKTGGVQADKTSTAPYDICDDESA